MSGTCTKIKSELLSGKCLKLGTYPIAVQLSSANTILLELLYNHYHHQKMPRIHYYLILHHYNYAPSDPAVYLQAALKDGFIPHKDDLFLVHGPGGVGKSSVITMFLGEQRDLTRVSTAVAEESLHLCPVRDVSTKTFTDKWELVDIDRQARMVAHTSHHLLTSDKVLKVESEESAEDPKEATTREPLATAPPQSQSHTLTSSGPGSSKDQEDRRSIFTQLWQTIWRLFRRSTQEAIVTEMPSVSVEDVEGPLFQENLQPEHEETEILNEETIPVKEDEQSLVNTLENDPEDIDGILTRFQSSLHNLMTKSKEFVDLVDYYSIRLVDSGGQPQFHEIVSILLPSVTGIVSVFKLSECLDAHGEVVFFNKDGKEESEPYMSYLTNEQVIRHDLLAVQSEACQSGLGEIPSLAFVGTFHDQQHRCTEETPDKKDKTLHSMITEILPERMQECVISNGRSLRQVTFRLNAKTPSTADFKKAGQLKEALMRRSQVKPRNLPLKWCGYEVALRKLMEKLGRQTLSLQECQFVGHKLGFDAPSLKACLHYLRQYHIISFHDVLPNVIFGSSQVILDKITELIIYSLRLKRGDRAVLGVERKFHQQGILCLEILQTRACYNHYRGNLFMPEDLLKVLKSLLIVTEVGEGEYLMPCVLEVSDIYPSPPPPEGTIRSSFVLHFSKKSPMIGIYCCTISYLLTEAGWKLLKEGGEVVQVARNSVTFELQCDSRRRYNFHFFTLWPIS